MERLDGTGVVVRLDLESNREAIPYIDDAGIFFAGAYENSGRFCGKAFEQRAAVFVGTMFAPHDGENAELGISRFAAKDGFDFIVFLRRQVVLLD